MGGMEVHLHALLTSALDAGELSALRPGRFTPGTHSIRGWVGPRAGIDAVAKRKISHHCPRRELNSGRPPVASSDWATF
jgi:hypothetical protein